VSIVPEFIENKIRLLRTDLVGNLYKETELVGWYSASKNATLRQNDMIFHKQFQ